MSVGKIGNDCCSCKACISACHHNAIKSIVDEQGFEQIQLDESSCVECGLCEKVCPVLSKPAFNTEHKNNYACYALDNKIKKQGSSGGLFATFATYTLKIGGVVYGAAFDQSLQLKTTRVSSIEDLAPLCKSKYLLCNTCDQYLNIKKDLENGLHVLYCATPCQISALRLFLRKDYDNLYTIEFVCHGVGSQTMFNDSVKYIQDKKGIKITNFTFREKYKSATSHYYSFDYIKNDNSYTEKDLYLYFPYYNAYCKQLNCRNICYNCHYAREQRVADITVGDFHTIAKYDHTIDRFAGVSMITCNNKRGIELFDKVKDSLYLKPFEWEILRENNRFHGGDSRPKESANFMESYRNGGMERVVEEYLKPSKDWKRLLYYNSPSIIRRLLTKII